MPAYLYENIEIYISSNRYKILNYKESYWLFWATIGYSRYSRLGWQQNILDWVKTANNPKVLSSFYSRSSVLTWEKGLYV